MDLPHALARQFLGLRPPYPWPVRCFTGALRMMLAAPEWGPAGGAGPPARPG